MSSRRSNIIPTLNDFTAGMDTDIDNLHIKANKYRKLRNARVVNVDGTIGTAKPIVSTLFKDVFSEGFVPLVSKTYNGVAYFVCFNETTGEGEIGVYPAPNSIVNQNPNATGFSQVYMPLWNFTGAANNQYDANPTRDEFRTTLFNLAIDRSLSMVLREDYDKTVNIYFCDGVESDKVINSGFNNLTGVQVQNRMYGNNSFPCFVEIMNESPFHPVVSDIDLIIGGELANGAMKVFFRYTSEDYNPTSFLAETNFIMVSDINDNDELSVSGGAAGTKSSKACKITLAGLDPAYKFIEVGYVLFSGDVADSRIINRRYTIDRNTLTTEMVITGAESYQVVDISQIVTKKPKEKISSTLTDTDTRLFRGDVKRKYSHSEEFREFAKRLVPHHDTSLHLDCKPFTSAVNVATDGQYKSWSNTYSYTGYFDGETYPFGVVFVFKDGTESDVYPTKGYDDFEMPLVRVGANDYGMYRFPNSLLRQTHYVDGGSNGVGTGNFYSAQKIAVMAVVFDQKIANTYLAGLPGNSDLKNDVIGFYYVRGERKKNLVYQGFTVPTFKSGTTTNVSYPNWLTAMESILTAVTFGSDNQSFYSSESVAPFLVQGTLSGNAKRPEIPYYMTKDGKVLGGLGAKYSGKMYDCLSYLSDAASDNFMEQALDRQGFFTLDHFYKKYLPKTDMYCFRLFNQSQSTLATDYFTAVANTPLAPAGGYEQNFSLFQVNQDYTSIIPYVSTMINPVRTRDVSRWNKLPYDKFVSYFDEGEDSNIHSLFSLSKYDSAFFGANKTTIVCGSLGLAINSYLGLVFENTTIGSAYSLSLCNLYIQNPLDIDITEIKDTKFTNYFKISQLIELDEDDDISPILYNGDCFMQRAAITVMKNPGIYPTNKVYDSINGNILGFNVARTQTNIITFGTILEYVAQHELNVAYRKEFGSQSYYPGGGVDKYTDSAAHNVLPESEELNLGYSKTTSPMGYTGFNEDLPLITQEFPTRIMGSNNHIINGFKDGYRNFAFATYKDYEFQHGRIIALETFKGNLLCVMENYVGLVPINERVTIGTTSGELAIGFGDLLPNKQQTLSQVVGSQHKKSIINTGTAVYGFDLSRRKLWVVGLTEGVNPISDSKSVNKFLLDLTNNYSTETDKTFSLADTPIDGNGIATGYDYRYGGVYWSFFKNNVCLGTISFNQKAGFFEFESDYNSPFYFTINEDFYSVNPFEVENVADVNAGIWQHDGGTTVLEFYGTQFPMEVKFIVNDKADLNKIWNNLVLISSGEEFELVEYNTQGQSSDQNPFIPAGPLEIWRVPKYKEDSWRFPINRALVSKSGNNNNFNVASKMQGNWIEILLRYNQNKPTFIKSIITEYTISNI